MTGIVARAMGVEIVGAAAAVTKAMAGAPRWIARIAVHVRVLGRFDERQRRTPEAVAHAYPVDAVRGIDAPITIAWVG